MERYLVVGLGNPGKEYATTRHNIGFMVVDEIASKCGVKADTKQSQSLTADTTLLGNKLLLVKPQTYMNLSGQAVRGLVDFYKIPIAHILVIYDDMDIDLGVLRIRGKGGAGGHNGVRSLIDHLGSQEFARIRFGISRPPGRMDPAAYVLRPFDASEQALVQETINRARLAIETWMTKGVEGAMNAQNGTAEEIAERQRKALKTPPETTPPANPES